MRRAQDTGRLPNWGIGLIAIVAVFFGFYLAFAKSLPLLSGHGYKLKAVFSDAQNIRSKTPVRIAGVDVGKVTKVEHLTDQHGNGEDGAVVTMELDDSALPIREDATLALRPRLFLEGNLFVDLQPGSPGADELASGSLVPPGQTSYSVQLDQALTTLQKPIRDDLQVFLKEFGDALVRYGGAEGFRESFRTSPAAYSSTSQVNEALLGTEPGDLAGVVVNLDRVAHALDQNEAELQDLVTNLRVVTGSFGDEDQALEQAIAELPRVLAVGRPALAKLNSDFPALRAFAREALPGVRAADQMLPDATPWIHQLRELVSQGELRGLVNDLRPTIPRLARLAHATVPFLEQTRALSSCFDNVVIPWSGSQYHPFEYAPGQNVTVYKETGYSLAGVAGESRSGDAQGQWFRVLGGGGTNTISLPSTDTGPAAGVVPFTITGSQPAKQSSAKTPFRPDAPCENQDPPNLASDVGTAPTATSTSVPSSGASSRVHELSAQYARIYTEMLRADALKQAGASHQAAAVEAQAVADLIEFTKHGLPAYRSAVEELTGGAG
jgi:phospholipid/cholesterol/gamma-HCH transport system substrate-binding protein